VRRLAITLVLCLVLVSLPLAPERVEAAGLVYTISGSTQGYSSLVKDTYIWDRFPTSNYGSDSIIMLEYGSWSIVALLSMDLSALSGYSSVEVESATLSLYCSQSKSRTLYIDRLRRPDWVETQATHNVYKSGASWGSAGASSTSTDYDTSFRVTKAVAAGWLDFNVKGLVQDAVDNRDGGLHMRLSLNYGGSSQDRVVFSSKEDASGVRPKITVTYKPGGLVQTNPATAIEESQATVSGEVPVAYEHSIDDYGFVWDAIPTMPPSDAGTPPSDWSHSQFGGYWLAGESIEEDEEFTHRLTDLRGNATYYFRAVVLFSEDFWTYGDQLDFKTLGGSIEGAPVLKVTVADVSGTNVRLNGELLDDGGENCTVSLVWGLTNVGQVLGDWDIEGLPDEPEQPQAAGEFYRDIVVEANMIYYWSATAVNSRGRSWAGVEVFAAFGGGGCDGAPMPPGSFTATMDGVDAIKLTWSKGEYADYTLIVMSRDDYPESVDGGDVIYYNTGTEHLMPVSELEDHGGYYFSGWGVNGCGQSEAYTKTTLAGGGLMANAMVMGVLCLLLMFASAFGDWRRFWPLIIIASLGWFFSAGWAMYLSLNAHDGYWVVAVVCIGMALATIMWPFIMKGPPPKIEELDEEAEAWGGKRRKRYPGRVDIE
jgi:hypothetical protein